jgi:hypothetical protein
MHVQSFQSGVKVDDVPHIPENLISLHRTGGSYSMDDPNTIDNEQLSAPVDLPPDEDLGFLESPLKQEPVKTSGNGWRFIIILGLLIAGLTLQSIHHGALFASPKDNHILVMYRTQIAQMIGFPALRTAKSPTYRLPFLEIAKEMQYGDRRTTVTINTSNAANLALPMQKIEVVWRLDPEMFLAPQMQPLINSNGIEVVVANTVLGAVTRMLNETHLDAKGTSKGFSTKILRQRIAQALSLLSIELNHISPVDYKVPLRLFETHQARLKARTELELLQTQKSDLVTQRTRGLAEIKTSAERRLAKMLSNNGVAMSSLQDRIDEASQRTETTITENRLSAETDREIYRLQAQHLMSVYKSRASNFRRFFETNESLHPELSRVVPTSLRQIPIQIPTPELVQSQDEHVNPEPTP